MAGPEEVRQSQIGELVKRVQAAEDGQVADLIGGDFNSTPESPCCRELVNSLGPGVQPLGRGQPFVTWDGLSAEPGAGQTLDYIFLRERTRFWACGVLRVAFAAREPDQRLSDHFGIEAVTWAGRAAWRGWSGRCPRAFPGWGVAPGRTGAGGQGMTTACLTTSPGFEAPHAAA